VLGRTFAGGTPQLRKNCRFGPVYTFATCWKTRIHPRSGKALSGNNGLETIVSEGLTCEGTVWKRLSGNGMFGKGPTSETRGQTGRTPIFSALRNKPEARLHRIRGRFPGPK